eukprot:COSAG01_NODE_2879_length_6922_cov_7.777810_5_plen_81_part_00
MANIEVVAVAISPALELGDKEQRAGAALNALAQALFSTQKVCARDATTSARTRRSWIDISLQPELRRDIHRSQGLLPVCR